MPQHCTGTGENTKSKAWEQARGKNRQAWKCLNLIHITVNLNGTRNPEKGVVFPKIYKAPYGNVQAHTKSLHTKKAIKLRLHHRSTNKIAVRKKLTKSITSKSQGYKYKGPAHSICEFW